ncbi:MAG: membrane protein insertase YidC [Candidatus Dadabacteria bacterium]|nr:membrane protein insertase YidC [Candidatus Dadabacteria bacterium]
MIILGYSVLFPPSKPKQQTTEQTPTGVEKTDQQPKISDTTAKEHVTSDTTAAEDDNIFKSASDGFDPYNTSENLITIKSALFTGQIDPLGARIVQWKLNDYDEDTNNGSSKYNLLYDTPPAFNQYVVTNNINIPNPIPYSYYGTRDINITDSKHDIEFVWKSPEGLTISKTYTIDPAGYVIGSSLKIENKTGKTLRQKVVVDTYSKTLKSEGYAKSKEFIALVSEEVTKESKSPEQRKQFTGKIGWVGFLDKYFLYTFLPETGAPSTIDFYTLSGSDLVKAVYSYPPYALKAGSTNLYKSKVYLGPLKMDKLKQAGSDLRYAMDFGWFDFLAKPVLLLLNYLNQYFNNYGISIIVITILIRLVFLPLTIKSMTSMKKVQAKMQELKPKIDALKEKYKDDKQKQNQEMMNLYTSHGVNPLSSLGGCLPLLIQIPVFIALYEVLLNSIDLRHSQFLWIKDLSEAEVLFDIPGIGIPFRILPLAMGVSWFISQKMTPMTTPGSEQMELQMKMMQFMPIIFTVMFWGLPSGLVLYWTVSNLLSIVQQLYVNRKAATH